MDTLYLLQFACFLFMFINILILGLTRLHMKWMNRRYEVSRWQDIVTSHHLKHPSALSDFHYYHIDAIGYVDAEQDYHHINPAADMEVSALDKADAEGSQYGGINAGVPTGDIGIPY